MSKSKIIWNIFSEHNAIKLEISNKKTLEPIETKEFILE